MIKLLPIDKVNSYDIANKLDELIKAYNQLEQELNEIKDIIVKQSKLNELFFDLITGKS